MRFKSHTRLQAVMLVLGLLLTALVSTANAQQYNFQTIAGGFDGDGGQALDANLLRPTGVVFDAAGNMLVSDYGRHRIRKISPSGVIVTLVGNGIAGYRGDGTADTANSQVNAPAGMVFDAAGNLYFADYSNHRVRKLGADGTLTLVAGNGSASDSGDGGLAVAAGLRAPNSLALDSFGNLYVSQTGSHRIRKIGPDGRISTYAGTGTSSGNAGDGGPATLAEISLPNGLAFDVAGNLLIAEYGNDRIRSVSPSGIITTFSSTYAPWGLLSGTSGELYVASDCAVFSIDALGTEQVIAGSAEGPCGYAGDGSPAADARVFQPEGMALDASGNLVIADANNGRIRRVANAVISTTAGRGTPFGDGGPAFNAGFTSIRGIALANDGRVFVADTYPSNRVRAISTAGQVNTTAGNGEDGVSDGDGGPATQAGVHWPHDTAMDAAGNLYIAEYFGGKVRRVSPSGIIDTVMSRSSQGITRPRNLAIDDAGNLYVADLTRRRVFKRTVDGVVSVFAGTATAGPLGDGGLATDATVYPNAVATDSFGNVFIADNGRIRKVTRDGIIRTVAGNGPLGPVGDGWRATDANIGNPSGVAVASNGDIYIAAGALRKVTRSGMISTVAELRYPAYDVAVANDGTIYVASLGGRVLKGTPVRISLPVPPHRVMPVTKVRRCIGCVL